VSWSLFQLQSGYYFINYFLIDGYTEAGERVIFSAGSDLAVVNSDKLVYQEGEAITINFENGPGTAMDWIGIFRQNAPPGTAPLVDREYIQNLQSGNILFNLALDPGQYYAAMYINNSNVRISNKADFTVLDGTSVTDIKYGLLEVKIYPTPSSGQLKIIASGLIARDLIFRISSITGKTIFEKKAEVSSSNFSADIDLSGADPGLYFIYLKSGQQFIVKKFVLE